MSELNNTATAVGNYDSVRTTLTSNTSTVNIVEGLSLSKVADQKNWVDGNLTYTITVNNQADKTYEKPVITDVIDTNLVDFIDGSVTIDGQTATKAQYIYNTDNHTLTINLDDVTPSSISTLTFLVKKKDK